MQALQKYQRALPRVYTLSANTNNYIQTNRVTHKRHSCALQLKLHLSVWITMLLTITDMSRQIYIFVFEKSSWCSRWCPCHSALPQLNTYSGNTVAVYSGKLLSLPISGLLPFSEKILIETDEAGVFLRHVKQADYTSYIHIYIHMYIHVILWSRVMLTKQNVQPH